MKRREDDAVEVKGNEKKGRVKGWREKERGKKGRRRVTILLSPYPREKSFLPLRPRTSNNENLFSSLSPPPPSSPLSPRLFFYPPPRVRFRSSVTRPSARGKQLKRLKSPKARREKKREAR